MNSTYGISAAGTSAFTDAGPAVTTLVNAPQWQISKSVVPTPTVQPGDSLTYTIAVTNIGHLSTDGSYTLTDQLPTNTNYVPGSATPAATFDGVRLTWVFTTPLGTNGAITATYAVTVTQPLTNATAIVNQTYYITGGNVYSPVWGAPMTVTVYAPVTMTITKADSPDPVDAGGLLTYTITVTNDASSKGPALGVVVTDRIPANSILVNAGFVGGTTGTTATNSSVVTWTITSPDPIPVGQSVQLAMTVRAQSPLPNGTPIINTYAVSATNAVAITAGLDVTTTVRSAPNITFTKTVYPQFAFTSQLITYTVVVTNSGNETAVGVPFTDTVQAPDFTVPITAWTLTITGTDLSGNPGVVAYTLVATTGATPGDYPNFVTATVGITRLTIGPVATVTVRSPVDLQIAKQRVGGSGDVIAGSSITYTITVTNAGPQTVNAVVTDTFAPGGAVVSVISSTTAGTCSGSGPVVCSFSSLTGTEIVTLRLNTSPGFSGTLTNTAVVTSTTAGVADTNPGDNVSTIATVVRLPHADLQLGKARVGSGDVIAGDPITYTVTLTNAPGSDTVDVVVTDTFTAGTVASVITTTGSCSGSGGGPVVCSFDDFTGTTTITLVLNTSPGFSGTLTNTAVVTFASGVTAVETSPGNEQGTVTTTVRYPHADLQLSKVRVGSGDVIAGDPITYTITLTNAPGSDTVNVVMTDTFTAGTVGSIITTTGSCSGSGGGPVVCSFDDFTGATTITLVLNTSPGFSGTLTNTAVLTFAGGVVAVETSPGDEQGAVTTTVRYPHADLQLGKARVGSGDVIAGDPITYTITLTNAPGSDTVDVVMTDTFTAGTVASVITTTGSCSGSGGGPVVCGFDAFTGATTVILVLNTSPGFSGTLTNTAVLTFASGVVAVETSPGDEQGTVTTTVRYPHADLQLSKVRVGSGDVIAGDPITYTITLTNAPGSDRVDVVVTDTFTAGTVGSVITTTGSCSGSGGGPVVCSFDAFTGTTTVTLVLNTSPGFSGTLTNTAVLTFASGVTAVETSPGDEQSTVTATVRRLQADLQANKARLGSGEVIAGSPVTYTITVANLGPATVDAVVTDTFTPGGAVVSVISSTTAGTCSGSGPVVCSFNNLTGTEIITLTLNTSPSFSGTLANTAFITATAANVADPNSGNNTSTVNTPVRHRHADLQVHKVRVGSGVVAGGDPITFTITIVNAGPDTVDAAMVDSVTPITAVTAIGTSAAGCNTSLPMICNRSNFTGTEIITVVMTTSPSFAGTLENRVTIGAGNADELFTPDNVDTVNVSVQGAPSLTITKTADPSGGNVRPDQTIYYTLVARNTGGVSATDVVISDTLPAGVGLVSVITSSGVVTSTTPLNVFASTLPAGNAITVTVQVTVTTGVSGTLLNNQASVDSNETGLAFSQIVSHRVVTGTGIVYLPIIVKNWDGTAPPAPSNANLRVIDIGFVGGTPPTEGVNYDVYVVVSNVGTDTVNTPFWVDLYLNPVTSPTVNQPWQNLSRSGSGHPTTACKDDPTCYGRAWRVSTPLPPGAVITLTTQMPVDTRYDRWPTGGAPYSSRHSPIVALVDSWGFWYGAVYENNETDNLSGSISGSGLPGSETTLGLPPRSLPGPGGEAPYKGDEAGVDWPPGRSRPSLPAPPE